MVKTLMLISAAIAAATGIATAQTAPDSAPDFAPAVQEKPTLEVRRAPGPIVLDGELDDAGWVGAARATGFSENFPVERGVPPVESAALVTYDDDHLYIAFIAHDDPEAVRTSIRDRDEIWSDDYFGILLDTYGDAAWAYFIFANPSGVQGDTRFATAGGEDDSFDIVYDTEAKVTEHGYQIEMAIPFKSLRFPDAPTQEWRATFWRTHPRDSRSTYTWAAMSRDEQCFLCQFGTLTGIEGVEPGGSLELFPSVVASQTSELRDEDDPDSGLSAESPDVDPGLGIRYAHPSGITAEAAINPDFSQVESDVAQIDANTTFALFFPERRPFFQEGSDLFGTFFDVVFTRQINDPDVAGKIIGRDGRTTYAYLGARDANTPILLPFQEKSFVDQTGPSVSNIGRVRRTYGESSYVGGLFTDRRLEDGGGSGTVAGIDGVHRFLDKYRLEYQFVGSHTEEPGEAGPTDELEDETFDDGNYTSRFDGESFSGFGQYTSLERSSRFWSFDFDYWASSPTFRADNGFEFRNDFRRFSMFQELNWYPETSWIDQFTADVFAQRTWTYDGERKFDMVEPTLEFRLTGQTFAEVGHSWARERFADTDFGGIRSWFLFIESQLNEAVQLELFLQKGRAIGRNEEPVVLGEELEIEFSGTLKPSQRLVIRPSVAFERLESLDGDEEFFSGAIWRTRADWSFTRQLFLRLIVQYDEFDEQLDIEPLLTYKVNPFTLFFVGSTQVYEDFEGPGGLSESSRQFFAKFQYLIQR